MSIARKHFLSFMAQLVIYGCKTPVALSELWCTSSFDDNVEPTYLGSESHVQNSAVVANEPFIH